MLVLHDNPDVDEVKRKVLSLPYWALNLLSKRAEIQKRQIKDILGWVEDAPPDDLVLILRGLIVEGGGRVAGRKRADGKQSAPHFEPMILGGGRKLLGKTASRGGPPEDDHSLQLIGFLAIDWYRATGQEPKKVRSDRTPFGNFVHTVFTWLDLENAESCLRRFWQLYNKS